MAAWKSLLLVGAALLLATSVSSQGSDPMVPRAKGTAVVKAAVKAAVKKVIDSSIFPPDHDFLRSIAWVESKDCNDKDTYRPGYYGGCWQVDKIGFIDTQTHPTAKSKLHGPIKAKFGIDWPKTVWSDLEKPFYSALAARMKLYITGVPAMCLQAIPSDVNGQALHWKKCYNTDSGAGTVEKYLEAISHMPK
ncbi:hypothetical protein RvY_07760 [Ramazzottius varieornatus]|uniref:Uncharacterized protein n=1 Tax=Ramazzottius varieornatus TaxID=947166 RepID=A0A1D1V3E5_RAMVA|nr:hypothetical protein RvY_07760 [Ramazzottius varieornatus]